MSRAASAVVLGGAWCFWALDFAGWVLMLAGASSMQADCGSSDATFLLSGGAAGYNAPVPCNRFFSYLWWHTFYNLTVWCITAATLIGFLNRFRPGLAVLLAISLMQVRTRFGGRHAAGQGPPPSLHELCMLRVHSAESVLLSPVP
jgi:hypothetical protein